RFTMERGVFGLPPAERRYLESKLGTGDLPGDRTTPNRLQELSGRLNLDGDLTRTLSLGLRIGLVSDNARLPSVSGDLGQLNANMVVGRVRPTDSLPWLFSRPAVLYDGATDRRQTRGLGFLQLRWKPTRRVDAWLSGGYARDTYR